MSKLMAVEARHAALLETVADLRSAAEAAGEAADSQFEEVERIRQEIQLRYGSQWCTVGTEYNAASRMDDAARLRSAEDLLSILRSAEGRSRQQLREAEARLAETQSLLDTHRLKVIRPVAAAEFHQAARVVLAELPRLLAGLSIRDNLRPAALSAHAAIAEALAGLDQVALQNQVEAERQRLLKTLD